MAQSSESEAIIFGAMAAKEGGIASEPRSFYQLGAPTLLYYERNDPKSNRFDVRGDTFPTLRSSELEEWLQRENRVKARWNHSVDLDKMKRARVLKKRKKKRKRSEIGENAASSVGHEGGDGENLSELQMQRFGMLMEHDVRGEKTHAELLKNHEDFDSDYVSISWAKSQMNSLPPEPSINPSEVLVSRMFLEDREMNSDPAYLAPFGVEALETAMRDEMVGRSDTVDKSKILAIAPRATQGNCLVVTSCPCPVCCARPPDGKHSWCLFHPKGTLLDTICVSNVIEPNGVHNAGHFFSVPSWEKTTRRKDRINAIRRKFPNEVCLDETIVEVKQGGSWDAENRECMFVIRTTTHISVVEARVEYPELRQGGCDFADDTCWGNYSLREAQRIDLRSFDWSEPSYHPVSLTCHPRFGNLFAGPKFAFASSSEHSCDQNVVHHCCFHDDEIMPTMHTFPALRSIDAIDFTSSNPMVLWSAAASFVRPALCSNLQLKNQPPLGFGTSLYTLDLRTNIPIFQWSPSAEEMVTEGIHSISGLANDWENEHVVWVTSKSAGKTWEVDSRMPCQAVNRWSLTAGCEDASATFPQGGVFGDPSLLTKANRHGIIHRTSPILNVDSTPGSFGIHMYQQPITRPRFQTESFESTVQPQLLQKAGITRCCFSSVYALPEVSDDIYTCGIAAFWTSLKGFATTREIQQWAFPDADADILCTLTLTNRGDIYCHSLLESDTDMVNCKSFPDLPIGTAMIPLPPTLDGKTSSIDHKSWKPSGGRNIKLFLSNRFPAPSFSLPTADGATASATRRKFFKVRREEHPSVKGRDIQNGYSVMAEARKSPNSSSKGKHNIITIPASLVNNEQRWPGRLSVDEGTMRSAATGQSDLSQEVLQKASEVWDGWDERDSDSDDDKFVRWAF